MKTKILIFCSVIIILFAGSYFYDIYSPFDFVEGNKSIIITIPQSVSAREIIKILKSNRIIRNEFITRVFLKITGWDSSLLAGEYEFFSPLSTKEVLKKVHLGEIKGIRITIPEGYTNVEIAELLASLKLVDKEKFVALSNKEEGFLFPDTYYFYKGISEQKIIDLMREQFNNIILPLAARKDKEINLDLRECVILASIVEKEANNDRKMVASVFLNRLRKKIKLESCVTVMYAIGRHKNSLYNNDLRIDSPYNTYLHYGLPPGPIGNPGRSALESVFNPAKSDFLFFVSRLDGTHEFSRTLQEHVTAKNKYKKISKKI
ncbi:MAG: endolytic transglycosylase MltG [bacterium]|nr:endolytic transglycosylase MltG [bacterium]